MQPIPPQIVFMGDSITHFWTVKNSRFLNKYTIINKGICGQTTTQMLSRFNNDVIELKPKKVIILAGINDIAQNTGYVSVDTIFENIKLMIQLSIKNKIECILCSVLPANQLNWNKSIQPADKVIELNNKIKVFAYLNNICFVDFYSKMVNEKKGLKTQYGKDGVHPNKDGYQLMESLLMNVI